MISTVFHYGRARSMPLIANYAREFPIKLSRNW